MTVPVREDLLSEIADMFSLKGRTALVTGGHSGLGNQIVGVLQSAGATCIALSRRAIPDGERRWSVPDHEVIADLTAVDIDAVFAEAVSLAGPIDILVNAAGISMMERAERMDVSAFNRIMTTNVGVIQSLSAAFVGHRIDCDAGGAILNIGSILGSDAMRGASAYAASKAALEQLSAVHALEWARHGIRVNVLAPGWFPTSMTSGLLAGPAGAVLRQKNPTGRLGEAGDLDGAVLLLVSDAGRYITGTVLQVDGGQHLA